MPDTWITLTIDDAKTALADFERDIVESDGMDPPTIDGKLTTLLDDVVSSIRGYISGCDRNTLETGDTIPRSLRGDAMTLIRHAFLTSLPSDAGMTDARLEAYRQTMTKLDRIAQCKIRVPDAESPVSGGTTVTFGSQPRVCF